MSSSEPSFEGCCKKRSVPPGLRTQRLRKTGFRPWETTTVMISKTSGSGPSQFWLLAAYFRGSILDVFGNSRLPRAREQGRRSLCCFMENRKGPACWQHQPATPPEAGPVLSLDPNTSFKVSSRRRCGLTTLGAACNCVSRQTPLHGGRAG